MSNGVEWESAEAQTLWNDFLRRLDWANRTLPPDERADARAEATAHIRDAVVSDADGPEQERLSRALARFGALPAPPPVWRRPVAIALHYLAIMVVGVSGLVLLFLLHMTVMELVNPAGVGLWLYPEDGFTLSYEAQPGAREILGGFFIPVMLAILAISGGLLLGLWRVALSPDGPVSRWMKR